MVGRPDGGKEAEAGAVDAGGVDTDAGDVGSTFWDASRSSWKGLSLRVSAFLLCSRRRDKRTHRENVDRLACGTSGSKWDGELRAVDDTSFRLQVASTLSTCARFLVCPLRSRGRGVVGGVLERPGAETLHACTVAPAYSYPPTHFGASLSQMSDVTCTD